MNPLSLSNLPTLPTLTLAHLQSDGFHPLAENPEPRIPFTPSTGLRPLPLTLLVLLLVAAISIRVIWYRVFRNKLEPHLAQEASQRPNVPRLASWPRRLLTFFVDTIAIVTSSVALLISAIAAAPPALTLNKDQAEGLMGATCYAGLFLYYFVFEALLQRTPGKFLTRTRVVNRDGSRPSTHRILARSVGRLVPFDAISVMDRTLWHDRWTKTRVVEIP